MYKFNNNRVYADYADDQYIVLNYVNGAYYSFDRTSSAVLRALTSGCSSESVIGILETRYGAECGIRDKVESFIRDLAAAEIVIPDESTSDDAEQYLAVITDPELQDMGFETFTDVADLLLMDPIHEVDEDAGWPIQKQ